MKCLYCDYETSALSEDDADCELEKHLSLVHPETRAGELMIIALLRNRYEFKVSIDDVVKDYFELREKLGQEFRKRDT